MTKSRAFLAAAALALAGCTGGLTAPEAGPDAAAPFTAAKSEAATHTYEVTIENLTTGQPFSPGVLLTHTKAASAFEVGAAASEGIRLIAETGDPSTAVADLGGLPGVHEAVSTGLPVHRIGGPGSNTLVVPVTARANANRLSLALMLICTNDGFTGLDGVKLPGGFKPATFLARAYDAGTEANDELSTSIVDPCGAIGPVALPADGDARTATAGVVALHPGIQGGADLVPALHGWTDPVARITIQRIQ